MGKEIWQFYPLFHHKYGCRSKYWLGFSLRQSKALWSPERSLFVCLYVTIPKTGEDTQLERSHLTFDRGQMSTHSKKIHLTFDIWLIRVKCQQLIPKDYIWWSLTSCWQESNGNSLQKVTSDLWHLTDKGQMSTTHSKRLHLMMTFDIWLTRVKCHSLGSFLYTEHTGIMTVNQTWF